MIQMVDLAAEYHALKEEIDAATCQVMETGYFIGGPMVQQFSDEFASFMQINHVVPCANGTDALQIAFMALQLQPGDEIIVPAFTYVAPAEAALLLGITVRFVDADPLTYNMDVSQLRKAINANTKAIVAVHLFGQATPMTEILEIAEEFNLIVIEDNAQATGATYRAQLTGTIGHIGTTSFFPSKNLGCYGDGGAVLSNDADLAQKMKQAASHGQAGEKFYHNTVGINSRLDALQAAILLVKLTRLPSYLTMRRKTAKNYKEALGSMSEIQLPQTAEGNQHTYHQFVIRVGENHRDALRNYLREKQIATGVYYPHAIPSMPPYQSQQAFPVATQLAKETVALPVHPYLTESDQGQVIEAIQSYFA